MKKIFIKLIKIFYKFLCEIFFSKKLFLLGKWILNGKFLIGLDE